MRKILIALVVVILAAIIWLWRGRDVALLSERFGTITIHSEPVKSLSYEGSGIGEVLHVNNFALDLSQAKESNPIPEIGTSKNGDVALSYRGQVFSFGKPSAPDDEKLAMTPPAGDEAKIETRRSIVTWPNPFDVNFMTGNSPSWKRFSYQRLIWKKSSGTRLEMMWRCEQFLYPQNDWSDACMTDPGFTGLIRVEISSASQ